MSDGFSPLAELKRLLPLQQRQQALSTSLQFLHRYILREIYQHPRILTTSDIKKVINDDPHQALSVLADADLIVLDDNQSSIFGAYPFSLLPTAFRLKLGDHWTYAMCALDALAVGPMFEAAVEIHSRCNITHTEVFIYQQGRVIESTIPPLTARDGLQIGIHWQSAGECAATSLCRDIVFLLDDAAALKWQQEIDDKTTIHSLHSGIELGADFFCPLLD